MFKFLNVIWLINNYFTCYWEGAAAVAGNLVSGAMGDSASGDAADAQVAGGKASLAELNAQKTSNNNAYSPYSATGTAANSRLAELMGISPAYSPVSASSLTSTDGSGNFVPNADLYSKDPAYKAAFDKAVQDHYASFRTDPNINKGSDLSAFNQSVLKNYGGGLDAYNASQQAASQNHSSDYGSLTKKFSQDDLNNDVVYNTGLKFGLDTGTNAIENRAKASGSSDSGSVLKALLQYGNDYGTTKANDAYTRDANYKNSLYSMLSGQQGVGLTATNNQQSLNSNLTTGASNTQQDIGNARSAGIIGGANSWSNALSGIGNYDYSKLFKSSSGNATPSYGYSTTQPQGVKAFTSGY